MKGYRVKFSTGAYVKSYCSCLLSTRDINDALIFKNKREISNFKRKYEPNTELTIENA